jgi:PKD repeat protein/pimeloyl-ACP methyl ester carboxylesterase
VKDGTDKLLAGTPRRGVRPIRNDCPATARRGQRPCPTGLHVILALLLIVGSAHGFTGYGDSNAFGVDTRDGGGTGYGDSASFAFDTRGNVGLNDSATSGLFFLDTRDGVSQLGAPVILLAPVSSMVPAGNTVSLLVVASGLPTLSYQWYFNGQPLAGATGYSLQLPLVDSSRSGYYSVRVSNGFGTTWGGPAQLIVYGSPTTPPPPTPATVETTTPKLASRPTVMGTLSVLSNGGVVDPNKPSIILTHGWLSRPSEWAIAMATTLTAQGFASANNIFAWDWHDDANPPGVFAGLRWAASRTMAQGEGLGRALINQLGPGYNQPIHFIGHSLGTMVNCHAADFLHGDMANIPPPKNAGAFAPWNTHVTLFDDAETEEALESLRVFASVLRPRCGTAAAAVAEEPYAKVVPTNRRWVDNYIGAVGLLRGEAANVLLWRSDQVNIHSYPQKWYRDTISAPNASLMGHRWSFERGTMGSADRPAANTYFLQSLQLTDSPQLLTSITPEVANSLSCARLAAFVGRQVYRGMQATGTTAIDMIAVFGDILVSAPLSIFNPPTGQPVLSGTANSTVQFYQPTLSSTGYTASWSGLFTLFPPGTLPQQQRYETFGTTVQMLSEPITNDAIYAWIPVTVPSNAVAVSFEFQIAGSGTNETFAMGIQSGTNYVELLQLEAKYVTPNTWTSSGILIMPDCAGQVADLFFALTGEDAMPTGQLSVRAIEFYKYEPAQAAFAVTAPQGGAPLPVEFTENSSGVITNWHWDFGDGATTNSTDGDIVHTYTTPGTYTVTLIVSGHGGISTNTQVDAVTVLTAYQSWQLSYFGCMDCPAAASAADPDGDGIANDSEFLAGTNPTDAASAFRIGTFSKAVGPGFTVTWQSVPGKTYKVQYADDMNGPWKDDLPDSVVPAISGETVKSYTDPTVGSATRRFYRVKLVIP